MAITTEAKIESKKLVKQFRKLGVRAKTDMDKTLARLARDIAKDAKSFVKSKKGTGLLKRSITFRLRRTQKNSQASAEVGTKDFVGRLQEFGTGMKGRATGYQMPVGMVGKVHNYGGGKKHGNKWIGFEGQQFMAKAVRKNQDSVGAEVAADVKAAIDRGEE